MSTPIVGDVLPERRYGPLTRTDIVRYQGASGDFNPVHHDEEFARAAGFPTVFSVGMLQAGILAIYAAEVFGPRNVRRFWARFRQQVWPGDVLVCFGLVTSVRRDAGELLVEVDLACRRTDSALAVEASATFAVNATDPPG